MKKTLLAGIIVATFTPAVHGALVFSDTFDYPDGPLVTTGSPWVLHSGTAGSMFVSNSTLVVSRSRTEDDHADLPGAPYLSSDSSIALYSSFNMALSNDLPTVAGTYFAHFRGTNTGAATDFGARVFVTLSNSVTHLAVPAGMYRVSIGNGAAATNNDLFGQVDMDLSTSNVYKIVTRFVPSTGLATIWINPNTESDPGSATASDPGTAVAPNPFNVYSYSFRQNSGEGTVYVDNLRVGTHFADVAGANTSPTISSIPDQAIPASSSTGPIDFAIDDAETPGSLTVSATSSNPSLIPNNPANLAFGGSGLNRTINVIPTAGVQGQATITVNVSDSVNVSFTTFLVTVGSPTISAIPNIRAYTNASIPAIPFTIGDPENDTLSLSASSSNPALLTSGNIVFGGSGPNRNVTLTPEADQVGVTTVNINVTDGHTTNTASFTLTVSPLLGLVFADDFNYTDFLLPNALYQATGSPWQTSSGTAYEVQVTNPLVYLNRTNTEDVAAPLTNAPYNPTDAVIFYTKFTANFSELPSAQGNYFIHLKSSTADNQNFRCRVFARTNGAADGSFQLGISINSATPSAMYPLDLDLNTTYTVVTRFNSATSESTLWINPVSESSASVSATDSPNTSAVGAVALRQDTGIGSIAIGALRIGTSFSDVLSVTAPAAEPIQLSHSGGNVILAWTNAAFSLYSATVVTGPYTKIDGATSPYTNSVTGSRTFFRLQWP